MKIELELEDDVVRDLAGYARAQEVSVTEFIERFVVIQMLLGREVIDTVTTK